VLLLLKEQKNTVFAISLWGARGTGKEERREKKKGEFNSEDLVVRLPRSKMFFFGVLLII
jgi:hypothetical protein